MKPVPVSHQHELQPILNLLKASQLPFQDITLTKSLIIGYYDQAGKLVGSGGLEYYQDYALLRSLAVDASERGKSIGNYIVDDLLKRAKEKPVSAIFLLTETAKAFFEKRNFQNIDRGLVPDVVKESTEFKTVCPASAACMVYRF